MIFLRASVRFIFIFALSFSLGLPLQAQQPKAKTNPAPTNSQPTTPMNQPAVQQPAPQPGTAPAKDGNQWALLVGISDYPGEIQDLRFARDDARALKETLTSSAGFMDDHVRLLTDYGATEAKATKQNILAAIEQLAARVQTNHQIIIFLAGHGIARGLGAQAKSFFLPVDVNAQTKETLEQTGLDLEELARKLSALKASQFTIFVDACREDPFPGRGIKGNPMTDVMARGLRITPTGTQPAQAEPPTSIVFYSCQIGERAYEDPSLKHGVFTYYILRGIQELANRPDGRVEAGQLAGYLKENVKKWTAEFAARSKYSVEQTPTMIATEVRGPMLVVRVSPVAENVPAPPNSGEIMITTVPEGAAVSVNNESLGRGPVQKQLQPNSYTVRAEMAGYQAVEVKINLLAGYQQEITLTLKPAAANPNYEKAIAFEQQQLWPQAIAMYEQVIRTDAGFAAAHERLAHAYLKNGRVRDAVDVMTTAAQKFADNAAVLAARSRALSVWAGIDEKDSSADASINPRPDKALKQKDAKKEALKSAEMAAQKDANLAAAHIALGYAYLLEEKEQAKALAAFVRASTVAPEDAESFFGVGYTYRLMKQYPQAVPQLKKATELRPDYYEAQRELAYCYHAMGENDKAISQYQVASGYRSETEDSDEMAANNLALATLYTQKGEQLGGKEGEEHKKAGLGYESDAREYDPTLKAAVLILSEAGVSTRIENYLPPDVRRVLNESKLPGGIKVPFKKKPWG